MSRRKQLWILIACTSITLMPAYALQGWLAGGHSAADVAEWFWYTEAAAWTFRAIVEAWAVVYLFQTDVQTVSQSRILWTFKTALIILIVITLGPAMYASGTRTTMSGALSPIVFWLWNTAIAMYAPLMLGAVGVAYRVQPVDISADATPDTIPVVLDKPEHPPESVHTTAEQQPERPKPAVQLDEQQRQIVGMLADGQRTRAQMADDLEMSRTQLYKQLGTLRDIGVLDGEYNLVNGNGTGH